jgi:hypothetical protein
MKKKLKSIPKFRSEAEERYFWETHGSGDYIDWRKAQRLHFPNLKPTTTAISYPNAMTIARGQPASPVWLAAPGVYALNK